MNSKDKVIISLLYLIFLVFCDSFHIKNANKIRFLQLNANDYKTTIQSASELNSRETLTAVCQPLSISPSFLFNNTTLYKGKPTINKFIIANPKAFLEKRKISKLYCNIDFNSFDESSYLHELATFLPVIYIAENHPDFGTLGFQLNQPSGKFVGDVNPSFKMLRKKMIFQGGLQNRGNSFTMLHKRTGFPENR